LSEASAATSVKATQGLFESDAPFRDVVDAMSDTVYVFDAEERLTYFNRAAVSLSRLAPFDLQRGETYEALQRRLIGTRVYDVPGRDLEAFVEARLRAFRNPPSSAELEMPDARRILERIFALADGGRLVMRTDITAIRKAEAEIARERIAAEARERERISAQSEAQIREMMEATTDAVFLFDAGELLVHCNAVARETYRHLGFEPQVGVSYESHVHYLLASGVHALTPAERDAHVRSRLAAFRNAPSFDEIETSTGQIYYIRVFPTRDGGRLLVRTDITAIRQAEKDIRAARDRAEEANRMKTDFLANVGHELRTPLNAIIGFSEFIGREALGPIGNPQYKDYLDDISTSGRHLLALVEILLDTANLESGRFRGTDMTVTLDRVLRQAITVAGARGLQNVASRVDIDPTVADIALKGDPKALARLIGEVVSNAVKFSPPESPVRIGASRCAEGWVELKIADQGIGIEPDRIKTLFEPFAQGDPGRSRAYGGAGIGLFLAKRIADLHGGEIRMDSRRDAGTTVTVRFPPERTLSA
jgi:signal transduction histidine kinase